MKTDRKSGILFHPTSISGTPGIGTIGKNAYTFVDWLKKSKQSLWQILPLGPTGYGDSPYQSFSTFAGNPLLIDLDLLVETKKADANDIVPPDYIKNEGPVDFGSVVWWKVPVLNKCALYFLENCTKQDRDAYEAFKNDNAAWLDNYANFMSIKNFYDSKAKEEGIDGIKQVWFNYWPKELASCDPAAVSKWNKDNRKDIEVIKVIQFFFFDQWKNLKAYANENGISIIGDIPIFVAADSADVWANQNMFQLGKGGVPKAVAGVPPDYFSATGQLWGNPLYDWDAIKKTDYYWWICRIKNCLKLVDYVRIDHFRGFQAYWSVPFGNKTAIEGEWINGPDHDLFTAIKNELGTIPIIAEDLGLITDEVKQLRDDFDFPGMKVLQFAFDPNEAGRDGMINAFLPHMYPQNCIAYTGTHDNDTMQGWLDNATDESVTLVAKYILGREVSSKEARALCNDKALCPLLIKTAMASSANMTVFPLQDVFAVGSEGRMNEPSTTGKNWKWRFDLNQLSDEKAKELAFLSEMYGRNF